MASAEQIVWAVQASHNVALSSEERKHATLLLQNVGQADAVVVLQAFNALVASSDAAAQLNGFSLLRSVVRRKWDELSPEYQADVVQKIRDAAVAPDVPALVAPVKLQLAYAVSDVAIRAGERCIEQTLQNLVVKLVNTDALYALVGYKVVQFLSEELGEGPASALDAGGAASRPDAFQQRKRELLTVMTRHGAALVQLLVSSAGAYWQQSLVAGTADGAAAARAAVTAALAALASLASWLPVSVVRADAFLEALAMLLQTEQFKGDVLELLIKLGSRSSKQLGKDGEDYTALFNSVARLLDGAVPLMLPSPGTTADQVAEDDAIASNAVRMADALSEFVVNGHIGRVQRDLQLALMQHLATLLGVGYLPISAATLSAWRRLVQGYERHKNQVSGAASEVTVDLPEDAQRVVMQHAVSLLGIVLQPGADSDALPSYVDSVAEWKEVAGYCKSTVKYILSEVGAASPSLAISACEAVLRSTVEQIQAAHSNAAQCLLRVDVLAFVLDAVLPSACVSARSDESVRGLERLALEAMSLQPSYPPVIAGAGRVVEALAPVVAVLPPLAPRLVDCFFALVLRMHAARGGGSIGNSQSAPFVREQRQLTKVYAVVAARAPAPFLPLLETIAQRTLGLVASEVLGDADKNTILEGVLTSAASEGGALFQRVVGVLLSPVRAPWQDLYARLREGEAALIAQMLAPLTQGGPSGHVTVGGQEERHRTYYTLQLLVFCARQARSAPGNTCDEVMTEHLEWTLLPALRLHRCLMGCARPEILHGPLKAIEGAFELSPLEKAACIGQQAFIDAKARTDELEPGRSDPCSIHGVRNWLRQCKELAMMLLSELCASCAHFWTNSSLTASTPDALLYCLDAQEPRAMRLVIHHGVVPLVRSCPPGAAAACMPLLLKPLVAALANRVPAMWHELSVKTTGDTNTSVTRQTDDEIVQEVLLREVSRDAMEVLRALVGSTSFPAIPPAQLASAASVSPYAFNAVRRTRARQIATDEGANRENAPTGGAEKGGPPLNATPWHLTVAHALLPAHVDVVNSAVRLAAAAMQWPDIHTQLRAIAVCRTVAAVAGAPYNPVQNIAAGSSTAADPNLQPLLVECLLPAAVYALARSDDAHASSEILLLIRSIYIAASAFQPSPSQQLRRLMPAVTDDLIAQLNNELSSQKTEKHHKDVLRRFFTSMGMQQLSASSDAKNGAAQVTNAALMGARRIPQNGPAVVLPDLFDIEIPP